MRETGRTELLKYEYSPEEIASKAHELARANQEVSQLEADKKQVMSDYKARIEARASEILSLSRSISVGFEMRRTECAWMYNHPADGQKTLVRKDTGEPVRTEPMTTEEKQEELPLQPSAAPSNDGQLATLHGEAILEEQTFRFHGKAADMAIRVFRTRHGWHWMFGMSDRGQTAQSVSSESPVPLKPEAIAAGAKALHDAVLTVWRRNIEQLTPDQTQDAHECMAWAQGISEKPENAQDASTSVNFALTAPADDDNDAAEAAAAE